MKKNYSKNDLIRYIYKETNQSESNEISYKIQNDALYNKYYFTFINVSAKMPDLSVKPDNNIVNNILNYSKAVKFLRLRNNSGSVSYMSN